MLLENLTIKNFKGIKDLDLSFAPGFNLLVGDNGVGKSSILEAASVALSAIMIGMEDVSARNILKGDVRYIIERDTNGVPNKKYMLPTEVGCSIQFGGTRYEWTRSRKTADATSKTVLLNKDIYKVSRMLVNSNIDKEWPLISYHNASRHFATSRSDADKKKRALLHDRRCGYLGSLDRSINMPAVEEWCSQMEWNRVLKNGTVPDNYLAFTNVIASFMEIMNEKSGCGVYFNYIEKHLMYEENGLLKEISDLSDGYKSILSLVIDLSYRLAILNPNAGNSIKNAEGIVLIDEIDSNLHPKWQWKIIDALTQTFPNIQFIAATHSPIILSACKNARIIDLGSSDVIKYFDDYYAHTINEILSGLLGHLTRPKEIDILINEFDSYMDEENYQEAKKALNKLASILGNDHIEVIKRVSEYALEAEEDDDALYKKAEDL